MLSAMTNETATAQQPTSNANTGIKIKKTLNGNNKVESLIVDSGPLIKGHQLVHLANSFYTVREVLDEIKDQNTRDMVASLPFDLVVRNPSSEAVAAVAAFSKKTGDYTSMSTTDMKILALTWMIEKETNGLSHIRSQPLHAMTSNGTNNDAKPVPKPALQKTQNIAVDQNVEPLVEAVKTLPEEPTTIENAALDLADIKIDPLKDLVSNVSQSKSSDNVTKTNSKKKQVKVAAEMDDDAGWITPQNIAKHKAKDLYGSISVKNAAKAPSVACMTTDFAMQNVLLQMNLNVLSVDGITVRKLRSWVLRCHSCYKVTKDMNKQFCPSCGNSTLNRVSVGINANGQTIYYLKKNFQVNLRGTRYSIPKPKTGRNANNLIVCEDQKEYQRALQQKQRRDKQLLNQDSMSLDSAILGSIGHKNSDGGPSLLTKSGMPLVGYGHRNVNASRGRRRK
ncbi:20S-pre-rRNA D-site endonuclease nob1 [Batrachochytrium dendrobatidis]|nr:20S-pre-rRNA D-site endonuclease nob1 [Batrachochytrium dendrobatidis]